MPADPPPPEADDLTLKILEVSAEPIAQGETLRLTIRTNRGDVRGLLDPCEGERGAVLYCDGAVGGPHEVLGPGDAVFERLALRLVAQGLTALRIHYRYAGEFEESVLDLLAGCSFLKGIGAQRVVLVGHSFGGAVVIKAGQIAPVVAGVAALSPQRFGTGQVEQLAKPLLLVHGADDQVLPMAASEDIYRRAGEPKRLVIIDGAGHALREGAARLLEELEPFLLQHAGPRAS